MGKWIRETDCEGKSVSYKCDKCGFDDGWHDYKLCPMCGDPKETESEDDESEDDGSEIEWPQYAKFLCCRFDCVYSDGTGLCTIQDDINPYAPSCLRYTKEETNGKVN